MAAPTRPNKTFEAMGWELQPTETDPVVLNRHRMLGRYPIKLKPDLDDWFAAIHAVLINTGYEDPCDYIGSYMYRAIAGTNGTASGHAYAICIDLDYGGDTDGDGDPTIDKNPHIHRKIVSGDPGFGVEWQILEHQVNAIEAIRNVNGQRMVRWLGWAIGDTMHLEPLVGPSYGDGWNVVDWSTVAGAEPEPEPEPEPPEEETMPPFDVWIAKIRTQDIMHLADTGIIETSEAVYFTSDQMWDFEANNFGGAPIVNEWTEPDWRSLYDSFRVRAPIWAV